MIFAETVTYTELLMCNTVSGYSGKIDELRSKLKDNHKQAEDLCEEIQ